MLHQLIGLTAAIREPDGTIGHAISGQMIFPATGIGCNHTSDRNFLGGYLFQSIDKVHTSMTIEEYRGLTESAGTGDMEVEMTRDEDLFCGDIKQGSTVLTNNQQ